MWSAIGFFFKKNAIWFVVGIAALLLATLGVAWGGWKRANKLLNDTRLKLAAETAARKSAQQSAARERKVADDELVIVDTASVKRKVVDDLLEVMRQRGQLAEEAMRADIEAAGTASDEVNRRMIEREEARKLQK